MLFRSSELPLGQELRIFADQEKLTNAFNKVLFNALKFTPDGGKVTVYSTLTRQAEADGWERFRKENEGVKVGGYYAPKGAEVDSLMDELLSRKIETIRDVSMFHIDFERIHPFNDGNGRIGRVLINWQLNKIKLSCGGCILNCCCH